MALSFNPLSDFATACALGVMRNTNGNKYMDFSKFGHNPDFGTVEVGLREDGGQFKYGTKAEVYRVAAGGDIGDKVGGTGAIFIRISGIGENLLLQSEDIELAGTSASDWTANKFIRVFDSRVISVNKYGASNIGGITLEGDIGGVGPFIEAGESVAHFGSFSTPSTHKALIYGVTLQVESGKDVNFRFKARANIDDAQTAPFSPISVIRSLDKVPNGIHHIVFAIPRVIPPLSDGWIDVSAVQASAAASVLIDYRLIPNI